MLLLHQIGSVKIGEVVRYTVTYTPSQDRILPSPEKLHLRVRNTSAIALRAAFVHGPYNLCVAAYPAGYNPNLKFEEPSRYGSPEFEPMIKAGGSWQCELVVPDHIRQTAGTGGHGQYFGAGPGHRDDEAEDTVTWIVEVSSQVIFSTSAVVGYEVVLARDEKSLNLSSSLPVIGGTAQVPQPGKVSDHQHEGYHDESAPASGSRQQQQPHHHHHHHHHHQPKGVFSRAVRLKVEDTATLWNTPRLPGWDYGTKLSALERVDRSRQRNKSGNAAVRRSPQTATPAEGTDTQDQFEGKQKKVHLVVLTHGLHSNLGADLLYLKESIDATVKQAKVDARERRARERDARKANKAPAEGNERAESPGSTSGAHNKKNNKEGEEDEEDEEEDEEVIVRGFSGNATRTERGIKYLGKRLARYILSTCYPDQPYLPSVKGGTDSLKTDGDGKSANREHVEPKRPFRITSISFVGHSLGGLVQTYAIAYVQKHSPQFFDLIKPVNFVTLATPFLGLSNENPLYIKFALDFGLVGRTGQDLGLTWRPPTIARSGWGAIVSNLGESAHKRVMGENRPESKPLLRILPTGPAHTALRKFRNRTIYSNVVNDGIVPLRTSCLLFLDWQGLGRVEKARRDAGLVETLVGAGWAELTGANVTGGRRETKHPPTNEDRKRQQQDDEGSGTETPTVAAPEKASEVPQPSDMAIEEDDKASLRSVGGTSSTPYAENGPAAAATAPVGETTSSSSSLTSNNPFAGFFSLFKSNEPQTPTSPGLTPKQNKIYRRSQTIKFDDESVTTSATSIGSTSASGSKVTSGQEYEHDIDGLTAPPRTTVFESAHDLINPTLPSPGYVLDPSKRPRTIFHDRVYHPSDIPPPPLKRRATGSSGSLVLRRRATSQSTTTTTASSIADTRDHVHANETSTSRSLSPSPNPAGAAASPSHSSSNSPYPSQGPMREDSMLSTKDYDDTLHTNPDKAPDQEVDGSQMRVEEKIARAYHRGVSWRKVLVKLEPDAHNNIIVRRMFANAFGWPVVKHLVDAHFSDAAAVRSRVDEEGGEERALDMSQPPDQFGGEIKLDAGEERSKEPPQETVAESTAKKQEGKQAGKEQQHQENRGDAKGGLASPPKKAERSECLAREAEDTVPELPGGSWSDSPSLSSGAAGGNGGNSGSPLHSVPQTGGGGSNGSGSGSGNGNDTSPSRRHHSHHHHHHHNHHRDSLTWSDGDWMDTDDEDSSAGGKSPRPPPSPTPESAAATTVRSVGVPGRGEEFLSPSSLLSPASMLPPPAGQPGSGKGSATREGGEDGNGGGGTTAKSPTHPPAGGSGRSSSWSWTEKIVGKKASPSGKKKEGEEREASSSTPTLQADAFLDGADKKKA